MGSEGVIGEYIMYHLIVIATLLSGGVQELSRDYYDSQAECLNKAERVSLELARQKDVCQYVEDQWFPTRSVVELCKKEIDPYSSMIGKCVKKL
jgi:hypothetical protein